MQDDVVMVLCNSNDCQGNCDLSLLCPTKQHWELAAGNPRASIQLSLFVTLRDLHLLNMGQPNLFTFLPLVKKLSQ